MFFGFLVSLPWKYSLHSVDAVFISSGVFLFNAAASDTHSLNSEKVSQGMYQSFSMLRNTVTLAGISIQVSSFSISSMNSFCFSFFIISLDIIFLLVFIICCLLSVIYTSDRLVVSKRPFGLMEKTVWSDGRNHFVLFDQPNCQDIINPCFSKLEIILDICFGVQNGNNSDHASSEEYVQKYHSLKWKSLLSAVFFLHQNSILEYNIASSTHAFFAISASKSYLIIFRVIENPLILSAHSFEFDPGW